jgi:hypothetical protein
MVQTLGKENITVIASVWPMSNRSSEHFPELKAKKMLSLYENGTVQPMDTWCDGHVYDPFSPSARTGVFGFLKEGYVKHGTALYCTALYCTALYCAVLYLLYCTALYCTAQYCAALYFTA